MASSCARPPGGRLPALLYAALAVLAWSSVGPVSVWRPLQGAQRCAVWGRVSAGTRGAGMCAAAAAYGGRAWPSSDTFLG